MKKSIKSTVCILLCISLMLSFAFGSFAYTNTAEAQRFNDDGTFRIMHITDTHLGYSNLDASIYLIASACDREKPDMIALTGDIAMSDDKVEMDTCIDRFMRVFEERNIPVAVSFGNHDIETKSYPNPSDLMALYNSYECSISVDEGDILTG
ncbi:MAG: metallophosphoesterase, partial [Clostridia bacterium]|nr:metallophosphoesterase [Clostridia bacterium]